MRKLGIIGLAIVAATAFGVWSASGCAVEGWEGGCACGVGSHSACDYGEPGQSPVGILVASLLSDIAASTTGGNV